MNPTSRPVDERLADIVEWGRRIESYAYGLDFAQFSASTMELRAAYRTRNRLIHGYGSVNLQVLWEAATVSVPAILRAAEAARSASEADE